MRPGLYHFCIYILDEQPQVSSILVQVYIQAVNGLEKLLAIGTLTIVTFSVVFRTNSD